MQHAAHRHSRDPTALCPVTRHQRGPCCLIRASAPCVGGCHVATNVAGGNIDDKVAVGVDKDGGAKTDESQTKPTSGHGPLVVVPV